MPSFSQEESTSRRCEYILTIYRQGIKKGSYISDSVGLGALLVT